jgi:ATP-dependent exoDNAse (exonuclease V) alpha subunit
MENFHLQTIKKLLLSNFQHTPTLCQKNAMSDIEMLISNKSKYPVMVLKGYAGTGKTTIIKAIAKTAMTMGKPVILLSPTGRGAKVIHEITNINAHTIHKHIYHFQLKPNGSAVFKVALNKLKSALFIIDEASMIQGDRNDLFENGTFFPETTLLQDIFQFVFSHNDNSLLFVGDPAQLPPVGHTESPALKSDYLSFKFHVDVLTSTLTQVVRQASDSGILTYATLLRSHIEKEIFQWPKPDYERFNDVVLPQSYDLQDMIQDAFGSNRSQSVIVCVSNKMANKYNNFIRTSILQREQMIDAGDYIMVVKNNYYWISDNGKDFLANGELMYVKSVRHVEEKYGFHFADVSVVLLYHKDEPVIDVKVLLDTLQLPTPALSHEQFMEMWKNVVDEQEEGVISKKKSLEILKENPYLNALQVKFAWAITCHKAQGGQWKQVFVDSEFLLKKDADIAGLRWLYTAVTRAKEQLVMIR